MDFEYGNRYLLTNVESKGDNPLREWLIGRQTWINDNIDTMLNKVYGTVKFVAEFTIG